MSRPHRERAPPERLKASFNAITKDPARHDSSQEKRNSAPLDTAKKRKRKDAGQLKNATSFVDLISTTVWQTFCNICNRYSNRPALGSREIAEQPSHCSWISYGDVLSRVESFSSGLAGLVPTASAVGICAPNVVEWIVADWACVRAGLFSVPIHVNRARETAFLKVLAEELGLTVVVCSSDVRPLFLSAGCVRLIVEIGSKSAQEIIDGVTVVGFDVVEASGRSRPADAAGLLNEPSTALTMFFSSGTTGRPKAVSLSEKELLDDLREVASEEDKAASTRPVQLAIYSFAYSLERDNAQTVFMLGGQLALFNRDMVHVFTELWAMRPKPTTILGVPALWTALFQLFEYEVEQDVRASGRSHARVADEKRAEFGRRFGQQLEVVSSGTAPLTAAVRSFMLETFPTAFIGEGYGTQETGLITLENVIQQGVSVQLRDLPELGYTSRDQPWPRGEICVKTPCTISQYLLQPEGAEDRASLAVIRGGRLDGYFATGDVGELREAGAVRRKGKRRGARGEEGKRLFVIDRVKALFKLSNGEYVSPVALESVYGASPLVHQIMVHGSSSGERVVAIVVPDLRQLSLRAPEMSSSWEAPPPATLADAAAQRRFCEANERALEREILRDLQSLARFHGLRAHECVARVLVACPAANAADASEGIGWSALNGALTPSLKLNRPVVAAQFRAQLAAAAEEEEPTGTRTAALQRLLPPGIDPWAPVASLGIDSLSAFRHANQLGVPVERLLHPETTVGDLVRAVSGGEGTASALETEMRLIRDDLASLAATLREVQPGPEPRLGAGGSDRSSTVLVTGATGFLGAVVVVSLMEAFADASVVCLVREEGGSEGAARERLERRLASSGVWQPAWAARLEVVVGCLTAPRLGLSPAACSALVGRRPLVAHCGAQVSWVQPYSRLRGPNVLGTVHATALCLQAQPPLPLLHISTGAAAGHCLRLASDSSERVRRPAGVPEDLLEEASGYVASKMVAEAVVQWAVEHRGLRAMVLRPGAVAPHSVTGFANRDDFLCRYLLACRQVGLCVEAPALCEFIPVDFVATAVVRAGVARLRRGEACAGEALGIANAASPTFAELGLLLRSAGLEQLRTCKPREFVQAVQNAEASPLAPLLPVIEADSFWAEQEEAVDPCVELQRALAAANASKSESEPRQSRRLGKRPRGPRFKRARPGEPPGLGSTTETSEGLDVPKVDVPYLRRVLTWLASTSE